MLASIDHIVLTTHDLERCVDFYTRVLGMKEERYGEGRLRSLLGPISHVHPPGYELHQSACSTPGHRLCSSGEALEAIVARLVESGAHRRGPGDPCGGAF